MSLFITHDNTQNLTNLEKRTNALYMIDIFLQKKPNIMFTSQTSFTCEYFVLIETKKLQIIQLAMQVLVTQKYVRFKFKPIQLVRYNRTIIARSQRCVIELTAALNKSSSVNKFYKSYLNKTGSLIIEITYSLDQYANMMHVQFILNKMFEEINQIVQEKVLKMLPFLNIQNCNIFFNKQPNENCNEQDNIITCKDKIKNTVILHEIYKYHRHSVNSNDSEKYFQSIQTLNKLNNLTYQKDINFINIVQKNRKQFDIKLLKIFKLLIQKYSQSNDQVNIRNLKNITKKQIKLSSIQQKSITHLTEQLGVLKIILKFQNLLLSPLMALIRIFILVNFSSNPLGTYSLFLSQTLFTYEKQASLNLQPYKSAVVRPLICKKIKNTELEASVKSFKNQLDFLFYAKDKRSKYIASYYLPMNQTKAQASEIFIDCYQYTLKQYLNNKNHGNLISLSFTQALNLCEKIIFGLMFLVGNSVLHRDLKPQNIMIDPKLKPRIIDFGSCCSIYNRDQFEVTQKRILTSIGYQLSYRECPQSLRKSYTKQEYDQHLLFDIYSFGIIFKQIMECVDSLPSIGQHQGINIKQVVYMLIDKCKQPDPVDRLTFDELLYYFKILRQIQQSK